MNRNHKNSFPQRAGMSLQKICWIALIITYGATLTYFITSNKTRSPSQQQPTKRNLRIPDEVGSRALPPLRVSVEPFVGSTKPPPIHPKPTETTPVMVHTQPIPNKKVHQSTIDTSNIIPTDGVSIAAELLTLAKLPSSQLKVALNKTGHDVFNLKLFEDGVCPAVAIEWLPKRTNPKPGQLFRNRAHDTSDPAMVWYEHLSKAGGTSFCKLAKKNMKRKEIPAYYCMPSEPGMPDARVGQWENDKLGAYLKRTGEVLVSNEWEPFPLQRLELQTPATPLNLVFVTTIREPLNRLLSAYRFWGVLHNPSDKKPPAKRWLKNMEARALADSKSPRGMGKGVGTGRDFIARVGMPNFATWKFSGGSMPVLSDIDTVKEEEWLEPFQIAVKTLSRFDLAIPMEMLSKHPEPLTDLLGWTDFSQAHVVPSGKVVKTDALTELGDEESFMKMWEANKLDMVLYNWVKATYLARINCKL